MDQYKIKKLKAERLYWKMRFYSRDLDFSVFLESMDPEYTPGLQERLDRRKKIMQELFKEYGPF